MFQSKANYILGKVQKMHCFISSRSESRKKNLERGAPGVPPPYGIGGIIKRYRYIDREILKEYTYIRIEGLDKETVKNIISITYVYLILISFDTD